jgi:hypothetical protein
LTWKYTDAVSKKKHSIASSRFQVALFGDSLLTLFLVSLFALTWEGGWEEGRFGGKSGKFCPSSPYYPKEREK